MMFLIMNCSKKSTVNTDPDDNQVTALSIKNIIENNVKPYKVQFMFSLRDQDDHAVNISETDFVNVETQILEDDLEIDYTESNIHFYSSDDFKMDIVLILDLSKSIEDSGGKNDMIAGAKTIINTLTETHRIAIYEFNHNDPSDNFSLIQDFTSDKTEAINSLDDFINNATYYPGFSLCWDTVQAGLELFSEILEPDKVRSLVFLSDGFDNNSTATPEELVSTATAKLVRFYSIAYGQILAENEIILQQMAEDTGGQYYNAESRSDIQEQFVQVVSDLGGNYLINYTTSATENFQVKILFSYKSIDADIPIEGQVNIEEISAPVQWGIISYDEPTFSENFLHIKVRADHIPGNIDKFRFKIDIEDLPLVSLANSIGGGLIYEWTSPFKMFDNYYETTGSSLKLGDSGGLFKITIPYEIGQNLIIPIIFDNSEYSHNMLFYGGDESELDSENYWYHELVVGTNCCNLLPLYSATGVDTLTTFQWEMVNFSDSTGFLYDLYLSPYLAPPVDLIAEDIDDFSHILESPLMPETEYFWNIIAKKNDQEYISSIWKFTTTSIDTTFYRYIEGN